MACWKAEQGSLLPFAECVWQQWSPNDWVFGVPVRGIVREQLAQVYRVDLDADWRWHAVNKKSGRSTCFLEAVAAAELAMGVS